MTIIFFGSDDFSLAALRACQESPHKVIFVVTTPPQKKGRGLVLTPSPVQAYAEAHGIPFAAPPDLKDPVFYENLCRLAPDLFVVSSYGKYIPSHYLTVPKSAALNVHPSLVPRYRGSGPIQWALLNGDVETGVSIIEVAKQLDGGDIFKQVRVPIGAREDHPGLERRLAQLSGEVLLELLRSLPGTPLSRTPQEENGAVYARKLTKEDGLLEFGEPAVVLDRKVRALKPWPGTYLIAGGARLGVLETDLGPAASESPGTVLEPGADKSLRVATSEGSLILKTVQPEGRKPMSGSDFANGRRLRPGQRLA